MKKHITSLFSSFQFFILGGVFTLALAWISNSGFLHWVNLKMYDQTVHLVSEPWASSTTVLINNDANLEYEFENQLDKLLDLATQHKAQHVVLITQLTDTAKKADQYIAHIQKDVYLATPGNLLGDADITHNPYLKHLSLFNIDNAQGISRTFTFANPRDNLFSLFEKSRNYNPLEYSKDEAYYFNHFLNINTLPNLTLSQALNGGIIDELVAEKIVLVDLDYNQYPASFYTPSSSENSSTYLAQNLAQIQALAVETLLTKSNTKALANSVNVLILLVIYTLCFFLLQLLSSKGVFVFGLALTAATVLLSISVLIYGHYLLPVFEWVVIQVFCMIYFISIERLREESMMLKMSSMLNARLGKKVQPPSFYQSEDPWDHLHSMLNQQLNLKRSIFLAKVPKDHRVEAIHALNCNIDDINEMRRDFKRSPYRAALTSLKPLRVDQPYFKDIVDSEVEYLCPLVFGGRMLGFWALTVVPDKHWNANTFENHLMQFATEIAELLNHRKNYQRETRKQNNIFRRIFGLKLGQTESQDLNTSVTRLEKRFDSLQTIYDGMSSASALYSLFGQVIYSNKQMEILAKEWKLSFYGLSAHDLLLEITALDSHQIKQHLLQATLQSSEVCLNIVHNNQPTHYILRIRPMQTPNDNQEQGTPFLLLGLLFEFVDIGEAQQLIAMKKDLYTQYFHQMRNKLGVVYLLSRQLKRELPDDSPSIEMLNRTLDQWTNLNFDIEQKLALQRTLASNVVPVNPCSEWQNVVKAYEKEISHKRIELTQKLPTLSSLVLAEPSQLSTLLHLICTLLVEDSDSNSSVLSLTVKDSYQEDNAEKSQRIITMNFSNEGYGVPESQLQALTKMNPAELGEVEVLDKLLRAADNARHWGFNLRINSTLGSGYVIELSMPAFVMN